MRYDLSNKYKAEAAKHYFNQLLEKGSVITLSKVAKKRSIDQNSLYWLWLTCIERETGMKKEELHLLYRANFLYKGDEQIKRILLPGLIEQIKLRVSVWHYFHGLVDVINVWAKSTTDLDTAEMTEYMERMRDHASNEMGVLLLTLEEEGFQSFYNEYSR